MDRKIYIFQQHLSIYQDEKWLHMIGLCTFIMAAVSWIECMDRICQTCFFPSASNNWTAPVWFLLFNTAAAGVLTRSGRCWWPRRQNWKKSWHLKSLATAATVFWGWTSSAVTSQTATCRQNAREHYVFKAFCSKMELWPMKSLDDTHIHCCSNYMHLHVFLTSTATR